MKKILENWRALERKTKLMALGTILLMAISICLSFQNCTSVEVTDGEAKTTAEEGVTIAKDTEPIPFAGEETRMIAGLVDLLSNENCVWRNPDDTLCSICFTEQGFVEYYGDIQTSCIWEFYEIEVTSNTRSGIWRITYPDGSTHDARFIFTHDSERGMYIIESSAFSEAEVYETPAFTSGDVLEW